MTERQTTYLAALLAEREQTLVSLALGDTTDAAKASFLLAWNRETEGGTRRPATRGMNVRQASEAIAWALAQQRDTPAAPTGPTADVAQGRYAIVAADGTVKFYKIDRPTEGRWSGYTFVKVQASDEWHRVPRPAQPAILAAIAADPEGAMRRYGLELGRCGNCGRTLTDETSRAMGIGPDCAARLGLDRSPYEAAANAERTARRNEVAAEPRVYGDAADDEDYAFGGGHRADVAAEAAAEMEAEGAAVAAEEQAAATGWQIDYTPGPSSRAATVTRPTPRLTWRERAAAVAEQQDAAPAPRQYESRLRQAAAAVAGKVGPYTLYVDGEEPQTFADGTAAYLIGVATWQRDGFRRVTVVDSQADTVAEWDF